MERIIVPMGYMGSGSSAITDLVSEFKDCQNEFKSYEYVLLHCPNGLFDFSLFNYLFLHKFNWMTSCPRVH